MAKNSEKERGRNGRSYFLGNNVETKAAAALIILCVLYGFRIFQSASFPSTWDEVDFVLAVDRFSLADMQPHFPGYPYFILGGMLFSAFTENNTLSLVLWSHFLLFSSVFPLFWLSKRMTSSLAGRFFITGTVQVSSYLWFVSSQPISEGAALGVMWWYIWSLCWADEKKNLVKKSLPLFLFSILMGIRLSYLPLGTGLLLLFVWELRKHRDINRIAILLTLAVLFQWVWLSALILSEGGIFSFLHLAFSFTEGHFTEWGGAITAAKLTLLERSLLFIKNTWFTGIAGENILLLVMSILLTVLAVKELQGKRIKKEGALFVLLAVSYVIYAFFAQNPEKPRHMLPVASLITFGVYAVLAGKNKGINRLLAIFLILQAANGFYLLKEARTVRPAVYQLEDYISKSGEPSVLYTWEETRMLQYTRAPFTHKRIETFAFFKEDEQNYSGYTVYLTGKALRGFELQGAATKDCAKKVKTFESSHLVDPVYSSISLYEWTCRQ
ncbi:nucleoporin-interacting protein [Fictibacillus aquaticus]|uniref:Glycosyltransferase RgtA/B/C/D-like domain-containing protein n=1 Tax=Fictibacillus aquaticus TaxID=2021314 RepID=A0A235F9W6_9BACL|nr:hypothetical protein [Fictibacillus aquaticus]OYD58120.1 hypothetical protein CGZ90_09570 [Fictibacillus aquaticus]